MSKITDTQEFKDWWGDICRRADMKAAAMPVLDFSIRGPNDVAERVQLPFKRWNGLNY